MQTTVQPVPRRQVEGEQTEKTPQATTVKALRITAVPLTAVTAVKEMRTLVVMPGAVAAVPATTAAVVGVLLFPLMPAVAAVAVDLLTRPAVVRLTAVEAEHQQETTLTPTTRVARAKVVPAGLPVPREAPAIPAAS